MVKKRVSSSPATPKKGVTPKIVFKKISSQNKNTKKKQLTPFNRIKRNIIKKSNVSKKLDLPSKGNILEDENPGEASTEKKKKNLNKDSKEPKRKVAAQVKVKEVPKNVSKEKKDRNTKSVPVPKKHKSKVTGLKPAKSAKASPKKDKTNMKMAKKPKPLPKKDAKGTKKETAKPEIAVEECEMLSPGGKKTRKSSADSKVPTKKSPKLHSHVTDAGQMDKIAPLEKGGKKTRKSSADSKVPTKKSPKLHSHVTDAGQMDKIAPLEKVSQCESAPDSLYMSSPGEYVDELPEKMVYAQEGDNEEHSLDLNSETGYTVYAQEGDNEEHSLDLNSETGYTDPDGEEDGSTTLMKTDFRSMWLARLKDLDDTSEDTDVEHSDVTSKEASVEPEYITTMNEEENVNNKDSDITMSVEPMSVETMSDETMSVEEVDGLNESISKGNIEKTEYLYDIDNNNATNKDELPKEVLKTNSGTMIESLEEAVLPRNTEDNSQFSIEVSQIKTIDEVLPKRDPYRMFYSPGHKSSSPESPNIEDDLFLSTSEGDSSSKSSVSVGSDEGLYEFSKIKKSKKNAPGPLFSKLPLKRKKDEDNIGKIHGKRKFVGSSDSSSSSDSISSDPSDYSRKSKTKNLQESPQYSAESTSGSSPTKIPKLIIKRLEENEHDILKELKNKGVSIKEAPVLSEKSLVGNHEHVLRTEIKTSKSHRIMDLASSTNTNTIDFNFDSKFQSLDFIMDENLLQEYNMNKTKESEIEIIDYIHNIDFYLNTKSSDLHFLPEGCSIPLTKIDCELQAMKNTSSMSPPKKLSTNSAVSSKPKLCKSDIKRRLFRTKPGIGKSKQKIDCGRFKTIKREICTNEKSNDTPDKSPIRTVQQTESNKLIIRKVTNSNIAKSESAPEPSIKQSQVYPIRKVSNTTSFKNDESSRGKQNVSIGNINAKAASNDAPKLTFKQPQFSTIRKVSNIISFNNDESSRGKPNVSIGNINAKAATNDAPELTFKQPQVYFVKKVSNVMSCENDESLRNKQHFSTGNNVKAPNGVNPVTQPTKKTQQDMVSWNKPDNYVNTMAMLSQCDRNAAEEDDDCESIMSIAVNPDLEKYVEDRLDPNDLTKIDNVVSGKKCITYTESSSRKNCGVSLTSHGRKDFNNDFNKQQNQKDMFYQSRISINERVLKSDNNQSVKMQTDNSQDKFKDLDSDNDDNEEEEEEEFNKHKRQVNGNKEIEYMKPVNQLRHGNSLKPNFMDEQIENGFPSNRPRAGPSQSGSNHIYGSDSVPYENLRGTPFDGYCLFYLRNSIAKSEQHQCDLRHEVPSVLFSTTKMLIDEFKKSTSEGIKRVCRENCINPPPKLLSGIITFYVTNQLRHEISYLVNSLKRNITVDKVGPQQYIEIWTHFSVELVKNIVQSNPIPESVINLYLQKIVFDKIDSNAKANETILYNVLGYLASMKKTSPSLKLLYCIEFCNNKETKIPPNFYPISFIEAVLHQVLDKSRSLNDDSGNKFIFKVYKSFFNSFDNCRLMYLKTKSLTERFLKIADYIGNVESWLTKLQIENGSVSELNTPQRGNIRPSIPEPLNSSRVPLQRRSSSMGVNPFLDIPTTNHPKPVEELIDPKQVFESFRSKGALNYLKWLQTCEDSVKKQLNDVTMSFILLESENEDSYEYCYALLHQMNDFDPQNVKDFTNENNTPARRLFVIITLLLKCHQLEEGVTLFLRYGFFEADHSKWSVQESPVDTNTWEILCNDLSTALSSLTKFTQSEARLFIDIMQHQDSLSSPVYLQSGLNNFFWKAANWHAEVGWNAIASIVLTIVERNFLKRLLLEGEELYRILVWAVCNADNMSNSDMASICARVMRKSNSAGGVYPRSWVKECHELTLKTCLTVEELHAFFLFKFTAFKRLLGVKSLHITFEEYDGPTTRWKQPYFRDVDISVKGVIERFKLACRKMKLEPTSLLINGDKITVDRIILQDTLLW